MNAFSKNLLMLVGGTFATGLLVTTGTLLVEYKPWGVPDVLREEYDQKVTAINARNQLIERWEAKPKPSIAIRSSYDLGLRDPESSEGYSFEIRNDGQEDLRIQSIATGNDVTIEFGDDVVPPGQTSELTLSWQTGSDPGPFELTATLTTNDPLSEKTEVKFVGEIKSSLLVPDVVTLPATNVAETSQVSFLVTSQLWKEFTVVDIRSDLEQFDWNAEALPAGDLQNGDRSAWRVIVQAGSTESGKFTSTLNLTVRNQAGEEITKQVILRGKVHGPIGFYGPEIHKTDGLDLGTLVSGKDHHFHLNVRLRGDTSRSIEVTGLEPSCLRASLTPQSIPGNYRLTITVPSDCPMVVFNLDTKRGYVEVGDPNDKRFSNWLPLYGVVVSNED